MDRNAARIACFELIQQMQSGNEQARHEVERIIDAGEEQGYSEVVRAGLYARAISSWMTQDGQLGATLDTLVDRSRADGDNTMLALGLALRAAFVDAASYAHDAAALDDALAQAVVLLDRVEGSPLEAISARTACGIAFDFRSMWELGDEQYAAALLLGPGAEPGVGETLLAAVMFNRAEAQVEWAAHLRQIGEVEAVTDRWRAWQTADRLARKFAMPESWRDELSSLGLVMGALAGEDAAAEADEVLAAMQADGRHEPRSEALLYLAAALSHLGAGRAEVHDAANRALQRIDPEVAPLMYDLALFVAAEAEATEDRTAGLLRARREITHRWNERLTRVGAMRSRIESERLRVEMDRLSREAHMDDLTGIANRRGLARYAADLDRRGITRVAMVMVDVDHFKQVNDRYGHEVGDFVLIHLAGILASGIRPADVAVRLGGDEFALVLAGQDAEAARHCADRLMQEVDAHPWGDLSSGLRVTVSMGIASGTRAEVAEVRTRADRAVYAAKASGGATIVDAIET